MSLVTSDIQLDAAAVRVLAHPLRSRLLTTLRRDGPATATELAERLDTNTGATSYHLRKLESVGLVSDTGEGEGKRRMWATTSRSHSWKASEFADDEDAQTSLGWLTRDYVRHAADQMYRWFDAEHAWPMPWRDSLGLSDETVTATSDQLAALHRELWEVITRYRDAGEDAPEAQRVSVRLLLHPLNPDDAPER